MKVKVTKDKQFIYVQETTKLEKRQLQLSLNVRIKNYWNHPLVKAKKWDGRYNFFKQDSYIPIGLWKVLLDICEKYNFDINFDFIKDIMDSKVKEEDIQDYFDGYLPEKYDIREYQIESVYMFAKYRRMLAEMATSSGKTLISYMLFVYLRRMFESVDMNFKMLIVVPRTGLVIQALENWQEYNEKHSKIKMMAVYGESEHKEQNVEDYDVVVGTYQSLSKKNSVFFQKFRCVLIDECHHAGAKSVKGIMKQCVNSIFRCGFSGTTGATDDSADSYGIQESLGPLLYHVPPDHLIQNDYATPVKIKRYVLNYVSDKHRESIGELSRRKSFDKGKLLRLEKEIAIESKKRLKFILKLILKTNNNCLVLFSSVEKKYGIKIKDHLREITSDREVYYVDGDTPMDIRENYKKKMETGDNRVLVASFGTFSEGISIDNIHYVFLVESFKSEKIIKQSIGRGMRKDEGKDEVIIIDIIDDYREQVEKNGKKVLKAQHKQNYLYKHGKDRMEIYKNEGFPIKTYKVTL